MNAHDLSPSCRAPQILVIDDDPRFLELVVVILSFDNAVTSAAMAGEGLALLRSRWFDLVCIDYDLPDMNGLDVLQQLAQLTPGTSGLLITGADVYLQHRAAASHPVLRKPFAPERLLSLTAQLVASARRPLDQPERQ